MSYRARIIFQILALSSLLCGCSTMVSDSNIHQKLVGAWAQQQAQIPTKIIYFPDGTWVRKSTRSGDPYSFTFDGTWEIKDGFIIETTSERTQSRYPDSEFVVEHLKVMLIDNDLLILRPSGETNLVTFKRL